MQRGGRRRGNCAELGGRLALDENWRGDTAEFFDPCSTCWIFVKDINVQSELICVIVCLYVSFCSAYSFTFFFYLLYTYLNIYQSFFKRSYTDISIYLNIYYSIYLGLYMHRHIQSRYVNQLQYSKPTQYLLIACNHLYFPCNEPEN